MKIAPNFGNFSVEKSLFLPCFPVFFQELNSSPPRGGAAPAGIFTLAWNPECSRNAHHQQTAAQLRNTLSLHRPDNNNNVALHSSHSKDNYYWRPPVRLHKQTPTGVPLVRHSYRNTPATGQHDSSARRPSCTPTH